MKAWEHRSVACGRKTSWHATQIIWTIWEDEAYGGRRGGHLEGQGEGLDLSAWVGVPERHLIKHSPARAGKGTKRGLQPQPSQAPGSNTGLTFGQVQEKDIF